MGEVTKPVGTGLKGRDLIHSAPLFFKIHGWATAMPSVVDNPHSSLSFPDFLIIPLYLVFTHLKQRGAEKTENTLEPKNLESKRLAPSTPHTGCSDSKRVM